MAVADGYFSFFGDTQIVRSAGNGILFFNLHIIDFSAVNQGINGGLIHIILMKIILRRNCYQSV